MKSKPDLILELSQKVEALEQAMTQPNDLESRKIADRLAIEINELNKQLEVMNE